MRKVMAILICALGCLAGRAQGVQDFASRLMERCADDTAIYCITISPKMMEQLAMKQADDRKEEMMAGGASLPPRRWALVALMMLALSSPLWR